MWKQSLLFLSRLSHDNQNLKSKTFDLDCSLTEVLNLPSVLTGVFLQFTYSSLRSPCTLASWLLWTQASAGLFTAAGLRFHAAVVAPQLPLKANSGMFDDVCDRQTSWVRTAAEATLHLFPDVDELIRIWCDSWWTEEEERGGAGEEHRVSTNHRRQTQAGTIWEISSARLIMGV